MTAWPRYNDRVMVRIHWWQVTIRPDMLTVHSTMLPVITHVRYKVFCDFWTYHIFLFSRSLEGGREYCKTRKFNLRLIFAIFTDQANQWKLNAANDIEGDCRWSVKMRWVKTFGLVNQWKFISAKMSSFTVNCTCENDAREVWGKQCSCVWQEVRLHLLNANGQMIPYTCRYE